MTGELADAVAYLRERLRRACDQHAGGTKPIWCGRDIESIGVVLRSIAVPAPDAAGDVIEELALELAVGR